MRCYVSLPRSPNIRYRPSRRLFERVARCDRLLTAKQLADTLAISPKTLYNYVTRGMIPYFKIESNVRFRAREVAEWLRQHSGRPGVLSTETASGAARR